MHMRFSNIGWSAREARLCRFETPQPKELPKEQPKEPQVSPEQLMTDPQPEIAGRMKANAELMRKNQPSIDKAMESYRKAMYGLAMRAQAVVQKQMYQQYMQLSQMQSQMDPQSYQKAFYNLNLQFMAQVRATMEAQMPTFKRTEVSRINSTILNTSGVRAHVSIVGGTMEQSAANLGFIAAEDAGVGDLPPQIQDVMRSQSERAVASQQPFVKGLIQETGAQTFDALQQIIRQRPDLQQRLTQWKAPFIRQFNQELRDAGAPGRWFIADVSSLNIDFDFGADRVALQTLLPTTATPKLPTLSSVATPKTEPKLPFTMGIVSEQLPKVPAKAPPKIAAKEIAQSPYAFTATAGDSVVTTSETQSRLQITPDLQTQEVEKKEKLLAKTAVPKEQREEFVTYNPVILEAKGHIVPKEEPKPAPKIEPRPKTLAERLFPKPERPKEEPKPAPKIEPRPKTLAERLFPKPERPKEEPKPAPKEQPKEQPKALPTIAAKEAPKSVEVDPDKAFLDAMIRGTPFRPATGDTPFIAKRMQEYPLTIEADIGALPGLSERAAKGLQAYLAGGNVRWMVSFVPGQRNLGASTIIAQNGTVFTGSNEVGRSYYANYRDQSFTPQLLQSMMTAMAESLEKQFTPEAIAQREQKEALAEIDPIIKSMLSRWETHADHARMHFEPLAKLHTEGRPVVPRLLELMRGEGTYEHSFASRNQRGLVLAWAMAHMANHDPAVRTQMVDLLRSTRAGPQGQQDVAIASAVLHQWPSGIAELQALARDAGESPQVRQRAARALGLSLAYGQRAAQELYSQTDLPQDVRDEASQSIVTLTALGNHEAFIKDLQNPEQRLGALAGLRACMRIAGHRLNVRLSSYSGSEQPDLLAFLERTTKALKDVAAQQDMDQPTRKRIAEVAQAMVAAYNRQSEPIPKSLRNPLPALPIDPDIARIATGG